MLKTNLYFISFLILLLLQSTQNAYSQNINLKLSNEGQKAFDRLLVATQFEDTALGLAAESSKLVEAYNVLLKEPSADAAFKLLLEKATLPGQLYALCGLWFVDNTFFRLAVEKYKNSDEWVGMVSGCLVREISIAKLIETKRPIIIDINHPKKSLDEYFEMNTKEYNDWEKRKKKKETDKPPEGYDIDIFNGGYSVWFRDRDSF